MLYVRSFYSRNSIQRNITLRIEDSRQSLRRTVQMRLYSST